jgi:hypothetical protein
MRQAPSVTAIIAAYNEEDVIGPVVADLLDQGVRVHLIDHASTDGTVAEAERLRERGSLTIERLEGGQFSLAQIIRRKEILAAELDSDWFVNADADEFRESPWPGVGFVEALREVDRLGFNAVDFAVLNFLPVDESFRKGDDPRQAFRFCEPAGAFDRLQIRCWKKQPGPLDLASTAGHEARFPGRRVFPLRFLLRHYPIRGQAHGERKVLQERLPRFAADERSRGWHVQYDAFHEGSSFLRESSSLMPFDPWSTRVALALHHRGVESLEESLASRERELAGAQADLSASRDAAGSLRDRVAGLEHDLAATRAALASQDAQVETMRRERETLFEVQGGLRAERDILRDGQRQLHAELLRTQQAFDTLRSEREQLLVARAVLEAQRDGVIQARESLRLERDGLVEERARLRTEHEKLMTIHGAVLREREELRRSVVAMGSERDALRVEVRAGLAGLDEQRAVADRLRREQEALAEEARFALSRAAERELQVSRLADELTSAAQAHERRQAALQYRLETLLRSKVWRWSAPVRALLDGLRRG